MRAVDPVVAPELQRLAIPPVSFTHLARLGDERGMFEHALLDEPRPEHGYCVDDVARALIVAVREPAPSPLMIELAERSLRFVEAALDPDGRCRNRMDRNGSWTDDPSTADCWGRAVMALGIAASHASLPFTRRRAMRGFLLASQQRSTDVRAMSFAAIGAAEVLLRGPQLPSARRIVERASAMVERVTDADWPWPEPRLRYANAAVPEMLILGGAAMRIPSMLSHGLELLGFLLRIETRDGHLSVTGTSGRGPGDTAPLFDQQAIEVAAIADACARALQLTGDERWRDGIRLAWNWFLGDNDSGTPMIDLDSGAGYDGLEPHGRNENRGAESTLAALSTQQHARRLLGDPAASGGLPGSTVRS